MYYMDWNMILYKCKFSDESDYGSSGCESSIMPTVLAIQERCL